jgi:DNA-directed RNA polymerase specialized sigma24 family protein
MSSRAAVTEVYDDLRPAIERICRRFAARRRLDPDELIAEGNLHFTRAYRRHRRARDPRPFDRYAKFFVHKQLLEGARLAARRERSLPRVPLEDGPHKPKFDLGLFLADLGHDACVVVNLLAETGCRGRRALWLRLGWPRDRFDKSLREIKEAMT